MGNKVINFHEVNDPIWFEDVVLYLKKKYRIIKSEDLLKFYYDGIKLKNSCLITVDDGHQTSYDVIYPILKRHNIPAVFFVSPKMGKRDGAVNFWFQEYAHIDSGVFKEFLRDECQFSEDRASRCITDMQLNINELNDYIERLYRKYKIARLAPQNMTIDQILEIDKDGLVEIGAHTMRHPFLANESNKVSRNEIEGSINELEAILGHPVRTFAYPNGRPVKDFGQREIDVLCATSVKLAFSTEAKNFSLSDDVYSIPRYGFSNGSLLFLKTKLFLGRHYTNIKRTLNILRFAN